MIRGKGEGEGSIPSRNSLQECNGIENTSKLGDFGGEMKCVAGLKIVYDTLSSF